MTMPTVSEIEAQLREYFFRYYETAFAIGDESVRAERAALLASDATVFQAPYLEVLPEFAGSGESLEETCRLAGAPPELADLARAGLLPAGVDELWVHQAHALKDSLAGKQVVVTSGTGSGKTEAFLLPILARLVRESARWPTAPASGSASRWWDKPKAPYVAQRADEARQAGIRALVLYPMNALVEDQLLRLRAALDRDGARAWFDSQRPGHRFYFGRYTSQTPVSGSRAKSYKVDEARRYLAAAEKRYGSLEAAIATGRIDPTALHFLPRVDGAEMRTRWDMQDYPPDILITNYSMLNIMLLRDLERPIIDATREWVEADTNNVFTLVIDELHLYRGTAGTEVAYLLRRLLRRLGLDKRPDQLSIVAASASLESDRERDRRYVEHFFAQDEDRFSVIGGTTVTPPGPDSLAGRADAFATAPHSKDDAAALLKDQGVAGALHRVCRNDEGRPAAQPAQTIAQRLFPDLDDASAAASMERVLDAIAVADGPIRLRAHVLFRNINGFWACSDPACKAVAEEHRGVERAVGKLYTEPRFRCGCGARVLELLYCETCGELFLGGYRTQDQTQPTVQYLVPSATELERLPDRASLDKNAASYTVFWRSDRPPAEEKWDHIGGRKGDKSRPTYTFAFRKARFDPQSGMAEVGHKDPNGWLFRVTSDKPDDPVKVPERPTVCPNCGDDRERFNRGHKIRPVEDRSRTSSSLRFMATGFEKANQVLSDALLRVLGTRKLVMFSDSRQDAAKLSAGLEKAHYLDLVRQLAVFELQRPPDIVLAAGFVSGEDDSTEAEQAHLRLNQADAAVATALLRESQGKATPEQTSLLEDARSLASANSRLLTELAASVAPDLLGLGINPAGPDHTLQAVEGRGWEELYDWGGAEPSRRLDSALTQRQATLGHSIDGHVLDNVISSVFSATGRDFEATGLASATVRTATRSALLSDEVFADVLSSSVRILGLMKRFEVSGRFGSESVPRHLKPYLAEVAKHHRVDNDALVAEITSALQADIRHWMLLPTEVFLTPAQEEWRCQRCSRRHLHASGGVCVFCRGAVEGPKPLSVGETEADYYAFLAQKAGEPFRLHCEELTGQTGREESQDRQAWFQEVFLGDEIPAVKGVDLLSVTTTMEAGVDIGGLQAVAMANMPPMRFNYQQRVGRAGRRGDALSVALTVCRGTRSHDEYYFKHPDKITGDPPPSPYIDVARVDIARRAIAGEVLRLATLDMADMTPDFDRGDNVHGQFGSSAKWEEHRPAVDQWILDHPAEVESGVDVLLDHVDPTLVAERDELIRWVTEDLSDTISELVGKPGGAEDLSQLLAERGLLPMFGFPSRQRYLYLERPRRLPTNASISRDLRISISEYAPGSELVKDKALHTAIGLVDYTMKGNQAEPVDDPRGEVQDVGTCPDCRAVDLVPVSTGLCPTCGSSEYQVMTMAQPLGYRTDHSGKDYDGTFEWTAHASYPRISIPATLAEAVEGNATIRAGKVELVSLNDNNGAGFRFGRVNNWPGLLSLDLAEDQKRASELSIPDPKNFRADSIENIALGARHVTDALLIGIDDAPPWVSLDPRSTPVRAAWVSFAFLLRSAAARLLDVETQELDAGVYPTGLADQLVAEAFLADSLENGAGYSTHLGQPDQLPSLFGKLEKMCAELELHSDAGEACDSSCYECLREYGNSHYHPLLDWRLAVDLARLAMTGQIDNESHTPLARDLANRFADSFPNWVAGEVAGVPCVRDTGDGQAFLIAHPLEAARPGWLSARLSEAVIELEPEGYSLNPGDGPGAAKRLAINTTFDLHRRPGTVESAERSA